MATASKTASTPSKVKPIKAPLNKTQLVAHIAEATAQEPKVVKAVLAALEGAMAASMSKKGAREFLMPGLFKVQVQDVPAKKARKGIDPFTKEERVFKAKPASVRIKVRAMKKLKDMATG